jgi:hypothetical protein
MGQKQAKLDLADNLREAVNDLNSISNPFEQYLERSEGFANFLDDYLEKSGNVLTLRSKLLQTASSEDIRTKLRQLLFEAAVSAQQTLELTIRLDVCADYGTKKREIREKIRELCMELIEPEQVDDALVLLRTTADGLRVGYLLRYLASSKAFTKLTEASFSLRIRCKYYPLRQASLHRGRISYWHTQ